jgi:hypothetical protein
MVKRRWFDVVVVAGFGLAGCSSEDEFAGEDRPLQQKSSSELPSRPSPPPAPGPNFRNGSTIAGPGNPDTSGLDNAQIDAMFDAAVAQERPGKEKRAVCVGMQGLGDRAVTDAPARAVQRLGEALRLPAVPASQCRSDVHPIVIATEANAILYTVKVESRDARGVLTFWAQAVFGNLGAKATQFRLPRENGHWTPKPTGLTILS